MIDLTDEKGITAALQEYSGAIAGFIFVLQFFTLMTSYNFQGILILTWIGWLFLIPGFLLMTLSISALRKYGEAEENKSWIKTTMLVDKGVYGVIRHPFSFGWIILIISLSMITQNWFSVLCMAVQIPLILVDVRYDEQSCITKFGVDYTSYKDNVKMFNIFSGLVRYYSKRRDSSPTLG